MTKELFNNLPLDVTIDIHSRLPTRAISCCKCVCKSWLELLNSNAFAMSRLSKSPTPGIVTYRPGMKFKSYKFYELEDGENVERHDLHYYPLANIDIPHIAQIKGSANGLLFLLMSGGNSEVHYVCNPFTREYVEVRCSEDVLRSCPQVTRCGSFETMEYDEIAYTYPKYVTYELGSSKLTGQYKVVRIFHGNASVRSGEERRRIIPKSECHVYNLGVGSWRRVEPCGVFQYSARTSCVFLNGNLHWIVYDSDSTQWISCFDLETECFSTFFMPPIYQVNIGGLSALGDCLCFCDHTRREETNIWLMKEYGVEKSWTKEYVINLMADDPGYEIACPIKVFKDGDIVMLKGSQLLYYSNKTHTAHKTRTFGSCSDIVLLLTPSIRSLKTLNMENVISY